ncbi:MULTISPECIES: hypothetical protein [unclassified Streptomyces]|uniref:hypothetical protein n=1 Tax=unclassified Streptomyces TaxID=2593676 RepID=UPI0036EA0B25
MSESTELDRGNDSTGTFKISLINLTSEATTVSAVSDTQHKGCTTTVDGETKLPASRQKTFKIKVKGCSLPEKDPFPVDIKVDGAVTFSVDVTPDQNPNPDWNLLGWFGFTLVVALVVVTISAQYCMDTKEWRTQLHGLTDSWTLKDSSAANVSLLASAFVGIFGASDILEALGDDTKPVLTLALVSSAIGASLVGAAPFAIQALRRKGEVTVRGHVVGSVLVLGATAGQLWVILLGARDLKLGWIDDPVLYILGALASILLVVYGWTNTKFCITIPEGTPKHSALP